MQDNLFTIRYLPITTNTVKMAKIAANCLFPLEATKILLYGLCAILVTTSPPKTRYNPMGSTIPFKGTTKETHIINNNQIRIENRWWPNDGDHHQNSKKLPTFNRMAVTRQPEPVNNLLHKTNKDNLLYITTNWWPNDRYYQQDSKKLSPFNHIPVIRQPQTVKKFSNEIQGDNSIHLTITRKSENRQRKTNSKNLASFNYVPVTRQPYVTDPLSGEIDENKPIRFVIAGRPQNQLSKKTKVDKVTVKNNPPSTIKTISTTQKNKDNRPAYTTLPIPTLLTESSSTETITNPQQQTSTPDNTTPLPETSSAESSSTETITNPQQQNSTPDDTTPLPETSFDESSSLEKITDPQQQTSTPDDTTPLPETSFDESSSLEKITDPQQQTSIPEETTTTASVTIKPGSRPSSKFDNDPSVSCIENPYPKKCAGRIPSWRVKQEYHTQYSENNTTWNVLQSRRLSCVDFYNQSDGQLLWWQTLQREAIFEPEYMVMYMENNNECPDNDKVNFYISDRNEALPKYVDWYRGGRLRKHSHSIKNGVSVCYRTHNPHLPRSHHINVVYSFIHCLYYYGKDFSRALH